MRSPPKLGVTPERLDQAIADVSKEQGMPALPLLRFAGSHAQSRCPAARRSC